MRNKLRRPLAFLLSAVMIVTMSGTPVHAVADRGQPETGLCEHHAAHTDDCSYTEETPGTPCGHEHTEDCYTEVAECVHEHTPECYPVETEDSISDNEATPADAKEREPENCLHICDKESGCITEKLNCQHEHDGKCSYTESTPGTPCTFVCEICNPQDSGEADKEPETGIVKQEQCSCLTLCTEGQINPDCPICGGLGAGLSDCKGEAEEENADQPEDTGICKHHQEHDADCGYIPKSEDGEGSPCTYECRICPVEDLIAALPDKVTEDNAEDVRAQLEEILVLYRELNEDEQEQIDLSRCYELQEALDNANAPMMVAGEINIDSTCTNILTAEGGGCPGHTFIGTTANPATIYVASGVHNVTFSDLNIPAANVGIASGATVNLTIDGTNTIQAGGNLAGIYVPVGATLIINGTGSLNVSGSGGGAGIGGAAYVPDESGSYGDSNCGTVEINGGTITATGGGSNSGSAGIGGAGGNDSPGNGGNVTINGGTVTATGGSESGGYYGGAGIGGGSNGDSGDGGTLTINGGHVTLAPGQYDSTYSTAYGFGRGSCDPNASTGTCELTLADASYLDSSTTLDPKGKYTINGDPTEDMIVVPTDLVYNGQAQELNGKIYIDDTKEGTGTYFNQTFTVKSSAEGWVLQDLGNVVNAGTYTATFTKGDKSISKTFTVAQSGTQFVGDGEVKTYNGDTLTTTFTASDTITVKATPTATGEAPTNSAMFAASFTEPGAGQMAVFVGDTQVSEPADAADGTYTMTVSAADVLLAAGGPGTEIPLTAKFVGNDNMADGAGTVKVSITAAAKAEKDGTVIGYYGESNLADAFARNSGNAGATITLLDNITTSTLIQVNTDNLTLDLNGKTYTCTDNAFLVFLGSLTIKGSGEVTSTSTYCLAVNGGTLNIENGSFYAERSAVNVSSGTIQLTGGSFTGETSAIAYASGEVKAALANYGGADAPHYAFYQGSSPYTPSGSSLSSGTFTVKECQHKDVTPTANNDGTHTLSCPYCGYTKAAENCDYGEYTHNDTSHTRICKLCGYQNVEAHNIKCNAEASGTVIAVSEACKTCGYGKDLGTVTIHIPKLVYGDLTGVVTVETTLTEHVNVDGGYVNNPSGGIIIYKNYTTISPPSMATLTGDALLSAGTYQIKIGIIIVRDEIYSADCLLPFTIDPAPLTADMVALSAGSVTYNGTEQKSALTVKHGETTLTEGTDYEVRYTRDGVVTNDFTSAGTVKITVTGKGNYTGTVTKEYAISKADVLADNLAYTQPADLFYTGQPKTAVVTANNLTGIGEITVKYKKDNSGDLLAEAKEPGTYYVYADISAGQNYNAAQIEMGSFTISYMATPSVLYNGGEKKDWYNGDVDVSAGSAGYTVSDAVDGDYKSTYHISAQEGTVAKTLYFMDASGHISEGVDVEVNFDLTPPTGEIAVGKKWWQNFLHFISFGNYAAKEYTVTIKAEDTGGSGVDNDKTEYVVVTGADQYTDADALKAANVNWMAYDNDSRPTIPVNSSPYVVYARLTDNAGNVTYISTDGILLDSTAPAVDALTVPEETKKDVTVGVTFTVSEAADYYYVVLPESSDAPSAEDIIVTCGGTLPEVTGTAIAGTVSKGRGAVSADTSSVSVEAKNLQPYTAYSVYVTAVDRAVDITNSAEGTPAGNIAVVQNVGFTTKKTLPVITKTPAVAGTYGQSVGEMAITGGTAQAGSTVLAGTWTVSDADKNEKPSAGTSEVTVIFEPDNANYDSVSVQASLTVSQRNLNAEGVTVSEVAGNYTYTGSEIKPPVAVDTGTPTSGISISDSGAALNANDFTVSYSNNKDAGTASVTITGKGNYTGSVTRTFTIGKAPGREVPDVSGSHTDNGQTYTYTVTPTEGAVYRMDNGAWQAENIFKDIKPGTSVTFYAMMPEDKNYEEGTPKYITVNFPKLTPAAPALTYKADRTNPADVKVTITPVSGAEYSFDGGKTWTESNEQGGFTTSDTVTLAIRLKETDTHNQSPTRTMTVNLAKEDREAPPAFSLKVEANGETDYTVTIPATEGCEYSFDGEHWSDVNVKTGVSVGETVTGYKRYKETNDYNASSAVPAKETMPKFTVKTPVISPAGGSYSGSVSVTITCGSNDAEIYYTTDGSTPGRGSTRYIGAFTVSVPATVKAVAIKDGLNDSAVATVSYTKKDGGGSGGGNSGGSSGGNENNGGSGGNDEGQGSGGGGSTNPGNGNTTPQPSVTQSTDTNINPGNETAPGTGTTPVNPGNGNIVKPGTAPGSGNAGTPAQGTKQPFIKGEDGKTGWDVIRTEEEQAEEGSIINVDMNGTTVVPGDIFDSIKGRDITINFDMGGGIIWSVNGKSITTDKAGDIDFSVQTGINTVPVDIVNNVTGERYSIQISLAYEGEFGFTAILSINLGKENAGFTASLYYYNESTGELEFICADKVAEDGAVSLAFTHASDYVIAIDENEEEESGSVTEPAQPEDQDGDNAEAAEESPQTGQAWRPWWLIVVGALVIIMGIGVFLVVRKGKDGDSGQ